MSTPVAQPNPQFEIDLDWKQEVNQRIAAHKSRRDPSAVQRTAPSTQHVANTRAAQAAARVAARYAKAPSYSQMLAEEARAAKRAAEAASQAALNLHAAAESVLAQLETVAAEHELETAALLEPAPVAPPASSHFDSFAEVERLLPNHPVLDHPGASSERRLAPEDLHIRWEPDLPVRAAESRRTALRSEFLSPALDDWRSGPAYGEPETVEPAQPIPANLIEFPRELIAARKVRPRIAEGPLTEERESNGQLSIFEVEPGAISTQPAEPEAVTVSVPEWSRIRLDAEQRPASAAEPSPTARDHAIHHAPVGLRLLAAVVDIAFIAGLFFIVTALAASGLSSVPPMKTMEMLAAASFVVIGIGYQAFFLLVAGMTPGMRYAGISLCTFDEEIPTRAQLRSRIGATLLSLAPVGLGILWAIFDEDHLHWHDRISHTYQRYA